MGWASLIAVILEVLGPILADWLKECSKEKLDEAAGRLPEPGTYANEGAATAALFDEAIRGLPRLAFIRRSALRRAKAAMVDGTKIRKKPLTPAEIEEGRDLVGAVKGE